MFMDDESFASAVNETHALYKDLIEYHLAHPHDSIGINSRLDILLTVAMDHFLYDVESVNPNEMDRIVNCTSRTEWRIDALAQQGMQPYNLPITCEELLHEAPGIIPVLLLRAVLSPTFHNIPFQPYQFHATWMRFVNNYVRKITRNYDQKAIDTV